MASETNNFGLRYPEHTDSPPAVHTAIENLAQDTDDALSTRGIRSSGASAISAEQSISSSSYVELGTPDRVSGIVLPANGLIFIAYQARWKESVTGAARAAIFIGTNQLKRRTQALSAPSVQETSHGGDINEECPLATYAAGLDGVQDLVTQYPQSADVTTGQIVGSMKQYGVCTIFADAGTYDVSIRFKASSGTVTALDRHLWVWSQAFGS